MLKSGICDMDDSLRVSSELTRPRANRLFRRSVTVPHDILSSSPPPLSNDHHSKLLELMSDDSDDLSAATPLNGQASAMGILNNGVQSTGNVQTKAAAFSRMNSTSQQSQHATVSNRRVVQQSSSVQHSSHHQSNETQTSVNKQQSTQLKSNLSEMQARISQMKSLSQQTTTSVSSSSSSSSSSTLVNTSSSHGGTVVNSLSSHPNLKLITDTKGLMSKLGDNNNDAPLDTGTVLVQEIPFPKSGDMSPSVLNHQNHIGAGPGLLGVGDGSLSGGGDGSPQTYHFEQKKTASSQSTKFRSGNFSTEQATANAAEHKRIKTGDVTYEEKALAAAMKEKVEVDGVTAEKKAAVKQQQRSLTDRHGVTEEETRRAAAASVKLSTEQFTAEKMAAMAEQRKQVRTQDKILSSDRKLAAGSQSTLKFKGMPAITTSETVVFEDLDSLGWDSSRQDVDRIIDKYSTKLSSIVESLRDCEDENANSVNHLNYASGVMKAAWSVPGHGHQVGLNLCKKLKNEGGLDLLIGNFSSRKTDLRIASARLLEQTLTPENCNYVVEKGFDCLDKVVKVASELCEVEESRVGTGLLKNLFKHSETTCSDVLRLQGLERVMAECRRMDVETLRNCAGALVNLSLYGGAENQEAMIKRKVHLWLFPLAFHHDDSIKYYACLAIAVLVANKEIEAQIIKSNTLQLVEPFLTTHNPEEFAQSHASHSEGQSIQWLEKLVPVLSSQREEARSLAAFHFCMEAGIKKRQGQTSVFKTINAIEPLKRVASSPNALASKLAAQALRLIGETVPHKLSQQVPLWAIEDVREWVNQKGFDLYSDSFVASRVDGDLLLQLTEDMLRDDIKMENGILRKRFMRDLRELKKIADYSSCDTSNLNDYLNSIHPEFCAYTYTLLNNSVDKEILRKCVSDEVLAECGIMSSIHRNRILDALREKSEFSSQSEENLDKPLDVFISYRRSNGSQLASLLKVHLALRGFSVFIDVERLEAGKFDNNLLHSIKQARHFLLVLTPSSLDRCLRDEECKDWVHREIVAALESQCNIIPIMDDFVWPETEELPEDMRSVHTFNGVKWIHDYQDACVDKIERFLRGEQIAKDTMSNNSGGGSVQVGNSNSIPKTSQQYQRTSSIGSVEGRLD